MLMTAAQLWAVAEAWDPALHPRGPGGRFIRTADLVLGSLHRGGGSPSSLAPYTRPQLRRAAKAAGLAVPRGATHGQIAAMLSQHVSSPAGHAAAAAAQAAAHASAGVSTRSATLAQIRDVITGTDPKSHTVSRKLWAFRALSKANFDTHLDPSHRDAVLADLHSIATTRRGRNAAAARKLLDRFQPAGTPAGSLAPRPSLAPPGAATHTTALSGTPGLLRVLPAHLRGQSGDGWTRNANGTRGPWGKYGAAGVLLRHTASDGKPRYLMVERGPGISDPGKWQFPGGAIDQHETPHQGAAREVVEELGLKATDLESARVHGEHVAALPSGWKYTSIAADVDKALQPDLSTHHARMETSDARWMTIEEIEALDRSGKLLQPLAGGALRRNVASLFPAPTPGLTPPPAPRLAHKPSRGTNLIPDRAAEDALRARVSQTRKSFRGKTADERLAAIGAMQGYDETPTVMSKTEVDRLLATGDYIEAWRGVMGNGRKTAAQINDDFRSGTAYYGTGIFGNGYYLSTQRGVAEGYSDRSKNSLVRVLIPKSTKTGIYNDVERKAQSASSSTSAGYSGRRAGDLGGGATLRNPGRYAAAAGLDGIEIPHTARSPAGHATHVARAGQPAYNWLNRSVLIVQEAEA